MTSRAANLRFWLDVGKYLCPQILQLVLSLLAIGRDVLMDSRKEWTALVPTQRCLLRENGRATRSQRAFQVARSTRKPPWCFTR